MAKTLLKLSSVVFCLIFFVPPAVAEDTKVMRFVTAAREDSRLIILSRLTLTEAFRRLGYGFELKSYPQKRCIALMKSGEVDGDATRVFSFNKKNKHPYYMRVEENHAEINFSVFMVNPSVEINTWDDLKKGDYRVGYLAGVKHSEQSLIGLIDPVNLITQPTSNIGGLLQLAGGRTDVYVYADGARAKKDLATEELINSGIALAGIVDFKGIYPYLQIKNKALANDLANQIREIKTEELFATFQAQAIGPS